MRPPKPRPQGGMPARHKKLPAGTKTGPIRRSDSTRTLLHRNLYRLPVRLPLLLLLLLLLPSHLLRSGSFLVPNIPGSRGTTTTKTKTTTTTTAAEMATTKKKSWNTKTILQPIRTLATTTTTTIIITTIPLALALALVAKEHLTHQLRRQAQPRSTLPPARKRRIPKHGAARVPIRIRMRDPPPSSEPGGIFFRRLPWNGSHGTTPTTSCSSRWNSNETNKNSNRSSGCANNFNPPSPPSNQRRQRRKASTKNSTRSSKRNEHNPRPKFRISKRI
mmetsp:Transcript_4824/g.9197  ORF Transcript_4824/g.9197 Transcript_4824/m.9197 type:complete len:276 (-) Transcript_4824:621-1448(-)